MNRSDIEQAADRLRGHECPCVDFAIEQVNCALEEAATLIDGVGKAEHADAEAIRDLKIKTCEQIEAINRALDRAIAAMWSVPYHPTGEIDADFTAAEKKIRALKIKFTPEQRLYTAAVNKALDEAAQKCLEIADCHAAVAVIRGLKIK